MQSIQEKINKSKFSNEIKSRLILRGLTIRKWAALYGYTYTLVYQVIMGDAGKLNKADTISGQIILHLKSEGFWPADEDKAA
jgi:gp16 family phage-associated protein